MPKNLEDELNRILSIRDGRRLLLTDTGRVIFERGLALLAEFRQLKAEFNDINQLKTGVLRPGIPPMIGMLMAGSIGLLRQRYPGIELKISEFDSPTVQQVVMNDGLDMALTALPVKESGLTALSLLSHPPCTLTPHSGKWLECDTVSPKTLAGHPLLIYNEDLAPSKQLTELFDEHGAKPRIAVRSRQWDFPAAMVQADAGTTILSEPICQQLDKNTLKWLSLESEPSWKLGIIWRESVYLSHSAYV